MNNLTENFSRQNSSAEETLEDLTLDTETKVIFTFLGITALLITVANSLVLVLAWNMKFLRTKTNLFLLSLAASDLLSGILVIPLVIACNLVYDSNSEQICIAMDICQRGLAISTILHLACAVIERYLKISAPFKYVSLVTRPRILKVLFSVWISAISISLVQLVWFAPKEQESANSQYLIYNVMVLCLFVFVPFIVTLVAFIRIFIIMKNSQECRKKMIYRTPSSVQKRTRSVNGKRSLLIYLTMLICFVLAWFPYFFLTMFIDMNSSIVEGIPAWINVMFLFLKTSSALFNPLLFTYFKADFQKALRNISNGSWKNASVTSANIAIMRKRTMSNTLTTQAGKDTELKSKRP